MWFTTITLWAETQNKPISTEELSKKLKLLMKQFEEIKIDLENIKSKITFQKADTSNELKEAVGSILELNRKLERINSDVINLMEKIEGITKEISWLKTEILKLQQRTDTLESTYRIAISSNVTTENVFSSSTQDLPGFSIEDTEIEQLNKKIYLLKKELDELKELHKTYTVSEIKDPNLRRILTSPYLVITSLLLSIFALITVF